MDRAMLERHLQQAEAHTLRSERLIARQRELVAELEQHGHDTSTARALLAEMEHLHELHLDHLDLIRGELADEQSKAK